MTEMNDFIEEESDMICTCVIDWLSEHIAWIPKMQNYAFIAYDVD